MKLPFQKDGNYFPSLTFISLLFLVNDINSGGVACCMGDQKIALETIKESILSSQLPLQETATHLVFGKGNSEAQLLFIGEQNRALRFVAFRTLLLQ